jgi:hypothetical protein
MVDFAFSSRSALMGWAFAFPFPDPSRNQIGQGADENIWAEER